MTFLMRFLGIEIDASPSGFVDIKGRLAADCTVQDSPGRFRSMTAEFSTFDKIALDHDPVDRRPIRLAVGDLLVTPVNIGSVVPTDIVLRGDFLGAPQSVTVTAAELPTTEAPKIFTLRLGNGGQLAHATFEFTREGAA